MGTRSRILIRRTSKNPICLWMAWDGYFSGQGNRICNQLARLLSKYSTIALQSKVNALPIEELSDEGQNFSAEHLEDFVEGLTTFRNDPCDDVEYEYTIDFQKGLLLAKHGEHTFVILFASIQNGFNLSELTEYLRL